MQQTRLKLILDYPFFGSLALTLEHIEDRNVSTCCTDGRTLRYNPVFIQTLTPNEKIFLYLHEICHIILGHSVRRKNRDSKMWNIAGDHAVNLLLRESVDLPRPEGGLCNTDYIGLSAEQIYNKLDEEFPEDIRNEDPQPPPEPDPDGEQNEDGERTLNPEEGEGDQDLDENGNPRTEEEPPLPMDENGQQNSDRDQDNSLDDLSENVETPGNIQADSENSQETAEAETPDRDRLDRIERYNEMVEAMERFGTVEDPDEELGLTESDIDSTTSLIDRMLNDSGIDTPEPIRRLVRQNISMKVSWTELLARFIHTSCEREYDWSVPDRRYGNLTNVVLPSFEPQTELSIAVVVDTSGSIDDALLALFMGELESLMNSIEYSKIHMISCSHRVFNPQSFYKGDELIYQPTGEGQTSFVPAFKYIMELDPRPVCVIYFTDLFSDEFGPEPEMPVLWVGNYGDWHDSHADRIPFGEIITMDEG